MKLAEFNKIKTSVDLVDLRGGGSNSDYLKNKIREEVLEMAAKGESLNMIKNQIELMLGNYVIRDDTLEEKTDTIMKALGIKTERSDGFA